jgi:hypothetical protein
LVYAAAGSVAAVSGTVIAGLHPQSSSMALTLTAALALATGVVFLVAGLVKLGWIVNFMSKAVIAGFITGMAIQIIVGRRPADAGPRRRTGRDRRGPHLRQRAPASGPPEPGTAKVHIGHLEIGIGVKADGARGAVDTDCG